jgi:nicotinamidase-related amidase
VPVIYVNDSHGRWDGDVARLVRDAAAGLGGDVAAALASEPGDPFLLKVRYSAFDHTPLDLLLEELAVERLLFVGATTEGCIVQSGIDGREHGFKVTILAPACTTIDPSLERVALSYAEKVAGMRIASSVDDALPARAVRS